MGSNLHLLNQWALACGVDRGWLLGVTVGEPPVDNQLDLFAAAA